ncbi:MAG: hypothetical protein MUF10_04135 [Thermoanaerobaculaceae bacterium]|nr:hypothetical protein [Thermoanaerobaculaceae bacterium]
MDLRLSQHPWQRSLRRWARPRWRIGVLGLALVLAGCFEQPVAERVELAFLAGGGFVVTARAEVRPPRGEGSNPALERRIAEARADFAAGWASWDPRFEALEPARERLEVERRMGDVERVVRQALAREPEGLRRFFAFTDVDAVLAEEPGEAELQLAPRSASRATAAERRRVERELESWSEILARYLAVTGELYRYLDQRPERAERCMAELFSVARPEGSADLDGDEARLVKAVNDAMGEVVMVLKVESGEAYTLDELSRRVFDPFPAPVSVVLPAAPDEVEGFVVASDGRLRVPVQGLWDALARLAGAWVAPDPVVAMVEHSLASPGTEFPLATFLALPRSHASTPPEPRDVAAALRRELTPAPLYRVRWATVPPSEGRPFTWSALPGSAR